MNKAIGTSDKGYINKGQMDKERSDRDVPYALTRQRIKVLSL